jgi:hypothetical protein
MASMSPTSRSSHLDSGVPQLIPSNKEDAPELVSPWPKQTVINNPRGGGGSGVEQTWKMELPKQILDIMMGYLGPD